MFRTKVVGFGYKYRFGSKASPFITVFESADDVASIRCLNKTKGRYRRALFDKANAVISDAHSKGSQEHPAFNSWCQTSLIPKCKIDDNQTAVRAWVDEAEAMIVMLQNLKRDDEELAETFSRAQCKPGKNLGKRLLDWLFRSTQKELPVSEQTEAIEVSVVLCLVLTVLLLNGRLQTVQWVRILANNRRAGDESKLEQEVTAKQLVQQHNPKRQATTFVLNGDDEDDDEDYLDDNDIILPEHDVPSDDDSGDSVSTLRNVVATDPLAGDEVDAALQKVAAEAKASRSTSKTQKSKKRRESGQFDDAFVASTERLVAGKQFVD